jgi:O-antigen/teichoic acid export membrane protein
VAASIAVTPWLLPLLFGRAFADAMPIAVPLLLAVFPSTLRQTIVGCLRAFGEARIGVTSELAALAGFLLACGPLLWLADSTGLASATIVGNLAGLLVCARHLTQLHRNDSACWPKPSRVELPKIRRFVRSGGTSGVGRCEQN